MSLQGEMKSSDRGRVPALWNELFAGRTLLNMGELLKEMLILVHGGEWALQSSSFTLNRQL